MRELNYVGALGLAAPTQLRQAGPMRNGRLQRSWNRAIPIATIALILGACTETTAKPEITAPPTLNGPNFGAIDPFNNLGACLAADVVSSGVYSGPSLASGHCTSQDIKIATADILEYSVNGGTNFIPFNPAVPVSCTENLPILLRIRAHVKETATSERTDIGVWIAQDGGNARTGSCNHYNLAPAPAFQTPRIENANHVWNIDNDQCGDMNNAGEALLELGVINAVCQTATPTDTLVHVGSCLGWTQPGGDQVCPVAPGGNNGFRFGTIPGTSSKCNCEGFDVPIVVNKVAKLEVVKACTPSTDPGTFDLLIDGSTSAGTPPVAFGENKVCGGSTGAQTLGAGTNKAPGAVHTFGEGDFTAANYTSSFSCVNRLATGPQHAPLSGTSLGPVDITLLPNQDVICTYTNVRKPEVKLVKALNPTTDAGKFDLTLAGTTYDNAGAGFGNGGNTGFQIVAVGTVAMSEAAHTGTTLSDYTSVLACVNAADGAVTVSPNNNTSGSITVAAGDKITCTITNTRKPRLKVVKATVPTSDPGKFDFTIGGTGFNNAGAGYGNGEGTPFQTLSVGNVAISEAGHTGTTLSTYTSALECRNAADQVVASNAGTSGTVPLVAGDVVTCTFTNTKGAALKLVKKLNPTNDAGKFDFTIGAAPFNNTGAGYGHDGTTGFQPVTFGSVSFSESAHAGTSLDNYTSALECRNAADQVVGSNPGAGNTSGSVTVAAGDQITCTFTNTRKPQVKLVKVLNPTTDGGKFDFTLAGNPFNNGGAGYGNNGTTGFQNTAIGSVSFSEAAHTGTSLGDYTTALECRNAASQIVASNPTAGNTAGSVTTVAGDQITCTFTNARKPQLKLVKVLNPTNDGGTFDFTLAGSPFNNGGAGYGHNGTTNFQNVSIGSVSFSEAAHTGTSLGDYTTTLACLNAATQAVASNPTAGNTAGSVTLAAGDVVTCTFTNTRKPQLKLVKVLEPTSDGGKFDFTLAGAPFNNGGAGYGHNGTTNFQNVSIGSVSFSEAGHSGTTLSEYGTTLACVNAAAQTVASNPTAGNTAGSVTLAAGAVVTCTFTNKHAPRLGLSKTPDAGDPGYNVSPGQLAKFTITLTDSLGGGPALNAAIIDTLPADVGDWTENPDQTECTITALPGETAKRLLQCDGATGGAPNELVQLNPGTSFTVIVQATVPTGFLQTPPDPNGPTAAIEIEGNLLDDPAVNGKDWATTGLISCSVPIKGCDIDLPTGSSDNSFGQGTSEDDAVPTVVTGSIPNNKSDLLRFYIANEKINVSTNPLVAHDILYLAWERVQAPNGTTNMDFELNQSTTLSSNGVTPVRTAGDILIKYDLSQGGTNPVLGFHRWILSGTCQKNGGKAPCWGPVTSLVGNPNVLAAINLGGVSDPIPPNAPRSLDALTFGEARVDLQATGIFQPGACQSFGRAYLKSRSSDSFSAEIKDFIAPIPIEVTNCQPRNLNNRVWARASNFAPPPTGALNDWFSDTGQIHVADASGATGSFLNSPTSVRLAQVQATTIGVIIGGVVGDEAVATGGRVVVSGAQQRSGNPWPPAVASEWGVGARRSVAPADSVPRPRLLA